MTRIRSGKAKRGKAGASAGPGSAALEAALDAVGRMGPRPVEPPSPGVAETQTPFEATPELGPDAPAAVEPKPNRLSPAGKPGGPSGKRKR